MQLLPILTDFDAETFLYIGSKDHSPLGAMSKETIEAKDRRIYDLEDRLVDFEVVVCRIVDGFPPTKVGNLSSNQLLRCSTATAPNYGEAQSAESRRDFVHKIKICLK